MSSAPVSTDELAWDVAVAEQDFLVIPSGIFGIERPAMPVDSLTSTLAVGLEPPHEASA